jgi:hypothetical protein
MALSRTIALSCSVCSGSMGGVSDIVTTQLLQE